ncbi:MULTISPECIES: carbohydrate kinase family protein [unclassified Rhizobium]|uniref:carbohydrate kinase family protein n=1 Tax=unclassified Rhizobium TaxID=2613769 RepID=UPI001ADB401F|nr:MULTISPECIES: carbohydrate kinase family protein [unclassified Rhizobium]MBO9098573.1 carbohydrate kinase family protein [Rhizobium sp. L58/93]MBO9132621.1 carbohydrate kinase family protein [Rhizobium sp. B209b/85]MBO9168839.1 carbohydrate kinase family protein [Rhizobium sp. L245/93]MBO9184789.1 carbohydrate kinase family protein [Rhizobium sp. E27B/91]QXZ84964.1 carbohydrate kinase family protein [Rhizobium sp. K1/93]
MSRQILVLGGAHIDRRGRIFGETDPGASNPGAWFEEPGGGGFNAARNLARLHHDVRMVSPRGGDALGDMVASAAREAGVDDRPFVFLDRTTPSYTAIIEKDGNLVIALADMELYKLFSPRRLLIRAIRDSFASADLILFDANLPAETLAAIARKAVDLGKPLAAIAISPAKVVRLKPCLADIDYLFLNQSEAAALTGSRPDDPLQWVSQLQALGLKGGVITRGQQPLVAFDGRITLTLEPPAVDDVADVTGAGDSLAAGVLSALMDGLDLAEAVRHGAAAAAITVQSPFATAANLSPQHLRQVLTLVGAPKILS